MTYSIEHVAKTLKEARERKGLSQRELSARSGVRQYQISKFENGALDLRLSSLIELARALELELSLVPRKSLSAVNALIRGSDGQRASDDRSRAWVQLLNVINAKIAEEPERKDYAQISRYLRELAHFSPSIEPDFKNRFKLKNIKEFGRTLDDEEQTKRFVLLLRDWRNQLAHRVDHAYDAGEVKPAYSLDEDDDG